MFQGTFGDNILMPLKHQPLSQDGNALQSIENLRAGNSGDLLGSDWLDFSTAVTTNHAELRTWWLDLIKGIGCYDALYRRGLEQRFYHDARDELCNALITLRPKMTKAITSAGLQGYMWPLDPHEYNPALPVVENLLYATPKVAITAEVLAQQTEFLTLLATLELEKDLLQLAVDIVEMLRQTFHLDGTDHPLFRKLGLEVETYEQAVTLIQKHRTSTTLTQRETSQLLAVPFVLSAEKIGPAFPSEIMDRVLDMRRTHGAALRASMSSIFTPLDVNEPVSGFTVLENAMFGKISETSGQGGDKIRALLADELSRAGLDGLVLSLIFETPIPLGGANVPALFSEPLAISRATIKRPDVLILDSILATYDLETRANVYANLRVLLPNTTIICLAAKFSDDAKFDLQFEMHNGRLSSDEDAVIKEQDGSVSADLARKLRALEQTELFSELDRKQLRLLAFGARWFSAAPGEYVFQRNDDPKSGAYLIVEGHAELLLPQTDGEERLIATSGAGKLVGELGLIKNEPRSLDMRAKDDLTCLRIGAEEFLAVVENDASTAYKLLQVVAGYVTN
jgi:hypothetical protein